MFTGIVEEIGTVTDVDLTPGSDARLRIRGPKVTSDVGHGDSIAVAGVCLTAVDSGADEFTVEVMAETLHRTTVGSWPTGAQVNLERSVTPSTRLGGHVVQGHVDGIGTVAARSSHTGYDMITLTVGAPIAPYVAEKGAIAVDGISLTVVGVTDSDNGAEVTIGVIPETLRATTMGAAAVGTAVNIEVDVMAKYVERLMVAGRIEQRPDRPGTRRVVSR